MPSGIQQPAKDPGSIEQTGAQPRKDQEQGEKIKKALHVSLFPDDFRNRFPQRLRFQDRIALPHEIGPHMVGAMQVLPSLNRQLQAVLRDLFFRQPAAER